MTRSSRWAACSRSPAAWQGVLTQRHDHGRLGRQHRGLQPAIAMAEALARLGDAEEVTEIELQAHRCQHLERKVEYVVAQGRVLDDQRCYLIAQARTHSCNHGPSTSRRRLLRSQPILKRSHQQMAGSGTAAGPAIASGTPIERQPFTMARTTPAAKRQIPPWYWACERFSFFWQQRLSYLLSCVFSVRR
jgi:hypothetical protein